MRYGLPVNDSLSPINPTTQSARILRKLRLSAAFLLESRPIYDQIVSVCSSLLLWFPPQLLISELEVDRSVTLNDRSRPKRVSSDVLYTQH